MSIISRKRTANLNGFSSINHSITLRVNFFTSTRRAPFGSQLWNGASRIRVGLIELCRIFLTRDNPWPILTRILPIIDSSEIPPFCSNGLDLTEFTSIPREVSMYRFRGRLILGNLMLLEMYASIFTNWLTLCNDTFLIFKEKIYIYLSIKLFLTKVNNFLLQLFLNGYIYHIIIY